MRLADWGELGLLDWIRDRAGAAKKRGLVLGIGDDAAVISPQPGKKLLFTTDTLAEGVHFDLKYATPYQLGFKLASVNASDIHAMGGSAGFAAFELTAPATTEKRFVERLFDGILDGLALYGAVLVGGNVSGSRGGLVLTMGLLGYAKNPVKRAGARPGDGIYVTGPLGDSAGGLEILQKMGKPVEIEKGKRAKMGGLSWADMGPLLKRHLIPEAKRPPKNATSMIDISDGLFLDLARVCKESRRGAKIYEDKIPVSDELRNAAKALDLDLFALWSAGGEDYELLYTAPKGKGKDILIGEIIPSGLYLVDREGGERPIGPSGWEHFGYPSP